MSKQCSQRIFKGLLLRPNLGLNHHRHRFATTPSPSLTSFASANGALSRSSPSPDHGPLISMLRFATKFHSSSSATTRVPHTSPKCVGGNSSLGGFRLLSLKSPDRGGNVNGGFAKKVFETPAAAVSGDFAKKVLEKPVAAVRSALTRYGEAIGLQFEAFFKRNHLFLYGALGVVVCGMLWKVMFGIASAFIGFSEGMAKYGFFALSTAIVCFAD